MKLPPTSIPYPWALVRRGGDTPGKRLATRIAYLTGTIVGPEGKAVALKGFIMNSNIAGWTKHPRRIEWRDVLKRWRTWPSAAEIRKARETLPVATGGSP